MADEDGKIVIDIDVDTNIATAEPKPKKKPATAKPKIDRKKKEEEWKEKERVKIEKNLAKISERVEKKIEREKIRALKKKQKEEEKEAKRRYPYENPYQYAKGGPDTETLGSGEGAPVELPQLWSLSTAKKRAEKEAVRKAARAAKKSEYMANKGAHAFSKFMSYVDGISKQPDAHIGSPYKNPYEKSKGAYETETLGSGEGAPVDRKQLREEAAAKKREEAEFAKAMSKRHPTTGAPYVNPYPRAKGGQDVDTLVSGAGAPIDRKKMGAEATARKRREAEEKRIEKKWAKLAETEGNFIERGFKSGLDESVKKSVEKQIPKITGAFYTTMRGGAALDSADRLIQTNFLRGLARVGGPYGALMAGAITAALATPKVAASLVKMLSQKGTMWNDDWHRSIATEVNALMDTEDKKKRLHGIDTYMFTQTSRYTPDDGTMTYNSAMNRLETIVSKSIGQAEKAVGIS